MGIVALCPNGHRIKVKDQFAGKKVMCPTCHAPFRVAAPAPASLPVARIVPLAPDIVATLPRAFALGAAPPSQPASATPVGGHAAAPPPEPVPLPVPVVAAPLPPEPAPPPPAFTPPWHPLIAEQPLATWSLAWPGGEPSAPMAADSMQQWLDSRQATGAELVWRSDWPEWRPLAHVFPEYVPPAPV